MKKAEIPALTGLRFVAAAVIVIDHLWPIIFKFDQLSVFNNAIHQLAYVGMTLFFVLSGFIIHYNYGDMIGSVTGLRRFMVARFSRLYPLYLALLLIDLFVAHPEFNARFWRMLTMTQSWSYQFDGDHLIAHGYRYSVVAWSISTEVFFYILYPVVGAFIHKVNPKKFAIGTILICSLVLWWFNANMEFINRIGHDSRSMLHDWLTYLSPYTRFLEFLTGCAMAHLFMHSKSILNIKSAHLLVIMSVGYLLLFTFRGYIGNEKLSVTMLQIGLLLPTAMLIFTLSKFDVIPWLKSKYALMFGDASYSMYLLHLIVAEYFAFPSVMQGSHSDWVTCWSRFITALLVIGVGSILSYNYFEKPALRLLRKFLDPPVLYKSREG